MKTKPHPKPQRPEIFTLANYTVALRAERRKRGQKLVPLLMPRDPVTLRHPLCSDVAEILQEARHSWGYTRRELAILAGISAGMIKKIELRDSVPTVEVLVKLCAALWLRLGDLFCRVDCAWPQYVQSVATIVR